MHRTASARFAFDRALALLFLVVLSSCVRPDPEECDKAQIAFDSRDYDGHVAHLRSAAKAGDGRPLEALAPILRTGHVRDARDEYMAHVIAPDASEAALLHQRARRAYRDSLARDPHHERANLRFAWQLAAGSATRLPGPDSARGVRYLERRRC